jgi:hypothetical protein
MLTEAERETIDLVFRAKRKLGLTPRETELLFALVREGKEVVTTDGLGDLLGVGKERRSDLPDPGKRGRGPGSTSRMAVEHDALGEPGRRNRTSLSGICGRNGR